MEDEVIKTIHNGVEITYHTESNRWVYFLNGRERRVEALATARENINKVLAEKRKPFSTFKAYWFGYISPKVVQVTGLALSPDYITFEEAWILTDSGRRKVSCGNLYPCNPTNDALVTKYREFEKSIKRLYACQGSVRDQLLKIEWPKE